ncbi:MAG: hypothetical protein ACRDHN_09330, partial [Thermomicrobiales bacterium]
IDIIRDESGLSPGFLGLGAMVARIADLVKYDSPRAPSRVFREVISSFSSGLGNITYALHRRSESIESAIVPMPGSHPKPMIEVRRKVIPGNALDTGEGTYI